MTSGLPVAARAEQQVASVRDDPAGRVTLMERCHYGPFGQALRHLPFRRAAMSRASRPKTGIRRGVGAPVYLSKPGQ